MLLDYIKIPRVFTFYTAHMLSWNETGDLMPTHHYCTKCGQMFAAVLKVRSNMGYLYVDDKVIYCPHCRERYIASSYKGRSYDIAIKSKDDIMPLDMTIKLEKFKYGLKLSISGVELKPIADMALWNKSRYTETITFDINKRKTIFKKDDLIKIELGDPFDTTFIDNSHFTNLFGHPCIAEYKKRMTDMMQLLRKEICKSLKNKLGHKIKSMYRSYGSEFGPFVIPIMNIAYRMICIDAPNLTNQILNSNPHSRFEPKGHPVYIPNAGGIMSADFCNTIRKEKDTISAFIKLAGLPNKRIFRRILAREPFDFVLLSRIYKTFDENIDNTITVYKYCITGEERTDYRDGFVYPDIRRTLENAHKIGKYYSGSDVMKLFTHTHKHTHNDDEFRDIAYMLGMMNRKIKDKFYKNKPSILAVHDWLASEDWKTKNEPIDFDIDTPLCKRLVMQINNMKFTIPKTSFDLHAAGKIFHNCVGTYTDKVINEESQIVFAADDKGKLTICIEVCDNSVVQAKLFANKLVSSNYVLNTAVIDWAEKAKVNWQSCRDIQPKAKQIAAIAV